MFLDNCAPSHGKIAAVNIVDQHELFARTEDIEGPSKPKQRTRRKLSHGRHESTNSLYSRFAVVSREPCINF
jgi:hypothetical protein